MSRLLYNQFLNTLYFNKQIYCPDKKPDRNFINRRLKFNVKLIRRANMQIRPSHGNVGMVAFQIAEESGQ